MKHALPVFPEMTIARRRPSCRRCDLPVAPPLISMPANAFADGRRARGIRADVAARDRVSRRACAGDENAAGARSH